MRKQICCLTKICSNKGKMVDGVLKLPPGVSFYKFPSNPILLEKWKKALKYNPQPRDHVCSAHFKPSDFREGLRMRLIHKTAVPSLPVDELSEERETDTGSIDMTFEQICADTYEEMHDEHVSPSPLSVSSTTIPTVSPNKPSKHVRILSSTKSDGRNKTHLKTIFPTSPIKPPNTIHNIQIVSSSAPVVRKQSFECRVCSLNSENNELLYIEKGGLSPIGKHLFKLLGVNLCPGDGYPTRICFPCNTQLKMCTVFQDNALQMHKTYESMLEKHSKNPTTTVWSISQCRVCSFDSTINERLFDDNGALDAHGKTLFKLMHVNLCPDDGFPNRICVPCSVQLKMFGVFHESAMEQQRSFERRSATTTHNDIDNTIQIALDHVHIEPTAKIKPVNMDPLQVNDAMDWKPFQEVMLEDEPLLSRDFFNEDDVAEDDVINDDLDDNSFSPLTPSDIQMDLEANDDRNPAKRCPACNQEFDLSEKLVDHILICETMLAENKVLRCTQCEQDIRPSEYILHFTHFRSYSDNLYECQICSRKCGSAVRLRSHIVCVHTNRQFQCNICNKAFKSKASMVEHRLSHSAKKIYCDESGCNRPYYSKRTLMYHKMAKHMRKVVCPVCNKGFCRQSRLMEHMVVHRK